MRSKTLSHQIAEAARLGVGIGYRAGFTDKQDGYRSDEIAKTRRANKIRDIAYSHGFFPIRIWYPTGSSEFDPQMVVIGEQVGHFDEEVAGIVADVVSEGGVDLIGLDGGRGSYEKGSGRTANDRFHFRYTTTFGKDRIPFTGETRGSHYLKYLDGLDPAVIFNLPKPIIAYINYRTMKARLEGKEETNMREVLQDIALLDQSDIQALSFEDMIAWSMLKKSGRPVVFLSPRKLRSDDLFQDRSIETPTARVKGRLFDYLYDTTKPENGVEDLYNTLLVIGDEQREKILPITSLEPGIIDILHARGVDDIPWVMECLFHQMTLEPAVRGELLTAVHQTLPKTEVSTAVDVSRLIGNIFTFLISGDSKERLRLLEQTETDEETRELMDRYSL